MCTGCDSRKDARHRFRYAIRAYLAHSLSAFHYFYYIIVRAFCQGYFVPISHSSSAEYSRFAQNSRFARESDRLSTAAEIMPYVFPRIIARDSYCFKTFVHSSIKICALRQADAAASNSSIFIVFTVHSRAAVRAV